MRSEFPKADAAKARADRIRNAREAAGLRLRDVSALTDISPDRLSRYEQLHVWPSEAMTDRIVAAIERGAAAKAVRSGR